jgi:hypothetical protein
MEQNNVRSLHTTVFTQQLEEKKEKKKKDVANCPALLAKKAKNNNKKQFHQYSFRSSTVSDVHVCLTRPVVVANRNGRSPLWPLSTPRLGVSLFLPTEPSTLQSGNPTVCECFVMVK